MDGLGEYGANDDLRPRLDLAIEAARQAGRLTLEYFRRPDLAIHRKADDSPVTPADRGAESLLRDRIAQAFPQDAVQGEEFPERPGRSGFRWVLDPIDGTRTFLHGVPLYTTLVAIQRDGHSVAGVIHAPALDETVYASAGEGAWHVVAGGPPRQARVSACPTLSGGLFVTSDVATFEEFGRRDVYDRLQQAAGTSRSWGDGYGYILVATGRAVVMIDPVVALWDVAAMLPILQEAGGTFTDWEGRPTPDSGNAVATNGHVFEETLRLVRG